ncbi:unnamed protein product [Rangifer tarandus platyrhynchus]|uniref:Uncharacterized protein n=1 Tax=Rangifer tarandus platyrhynchus TaxID=3082113 RepID=A0AC59ZFP9_RANTA
MGLTGLKSRHGPDCFLEALWKNPSPGLFQLLQAAFHHSTVTSSVLKSLPQTPTSTWEAQSLSSTLVQARGQSPGFRVQRQDSELPTATQNQDENSQSVCRFVRLHV